MRTINSNMQPDQADKCAAICEYYGFDSQREILVEECAELIQAVVKGKRRGESVTDNFLEELADVSIMIAQMLTALTDSQFNQFLRWQSFKLDRQIARIGGTGDESKTR